MRGLSPSENTQAADGGQHDDTEPSPARRVRAGVLSGRPTTSPGPEHGAWHITGRRASLLSEWVALGTLSHQVPASFPG